MTVLCCPSCGGEMSLDVLIAHNELRRATAYLVERNLTLGSLVLRYVGLFRPAKNRMSADRWAKLITQLQPDIARGAITHKGREWAVPLESWRAGLEAMLEKAAADKLTLPLDSHAYLYTVLAGMADKVEGKAEERVELERRDVRVTGPSAGPVAIGDLLPAKAGVPEHVKAFSASIPRPLHSSQPKEPS